MYGLRWSRSGHRRARARGVFAAPLTAGERGDALAERRPAPVQPGKHPGLRESQSKPDQRHQFSPSSLRDAFKDVSHEAVTSAGACIAS